MSEHIFLVCQVHEHVLCKSPRRHRLLIWSSCFYVLGLFFRGLFSFAGSMNGPYIILYIYIYIHIYLRVLVVSGYIITVIEVISKLMHVYDQRKLYPPQVPKFNLGTSMFWSVVSNIFYFPFHIGDNPSH